MIAHAPHADIDLFADDVLLDPYPVLDELRAMGSVVHLPSADAYMLTRYDACHDALRDWEVFQSGKGVMMNEPTNEALGGRIMLCTDGEHHTRLRRIVAAPLTPKALEDVRANVADEARSLVDRVVAAGAFDAAGEIAHHLPVTIVSSLVGFPEQGRERMVEWATAALDAVGPLNARTMAAQPLLGEMNEFMGSQCVPGKLSPDGWAQHVWDAVGAGQLESHEAFPLMTDYMGPALDTTINATANLLWLLARHPDAWQNLRTRPELVVNAINESLRLESTIQLFSRVTTRDQVVDGVTIPEGARVIVHFACANRDERMFPDPTRFMIDRQNADRHLALGFGRHACPGGHLAKLEMSAIVGRLLERVQTMELVDARRVIHNIIRGFETCVVKVEVEAA